MEPGQCAAGKAAGHEPGERRGGEEEEVDAPTRDPSEGSAGEKRSPRDGSCPQRRERPQGQWNDEDAKVLVVAALRRDPARGREQYAAPWSDAADSQPAKPRRRAEE